MEVWKMQKYSQNFSSIFLNVNEEYVSVLIFLSKSGKGIKSRSRAGTLLPI